MTRTIGVRLTADQIKTLDALAASLSERADGVPVSRSHVLRKLIERGLAEDKFLWNRIGTSRKAKP
jgi:hypothetical protein